MQPSKYHLLFCRCVFKPHVHGLNRRNYRHLSHRHHQIIMIIIITIMFILECSMVTKQHRAFLLTQPVFNNYLYTTCFSHLIIIMCTTQKLKIQGKSAQKFCEMSQIMSYVLNVQYTLQSVFVT